MTSSENRGVWPTGDPRAACLILDFDGTLAPIVADPTQSTMPQSTRDLLVRLSGSLGRVAIVSGRPAFFLSQRVGVPGIQLVGLYGLESITSGSVVADERTLPYMEGLARARDHLSEVVQNWPGVYLEDKGRAVAVHWRRAEDPDAAEARLTEEVRRAAGGGPGPALGVEEGKMVIELRPPIDADKGTAVASLADGYDDVAYAGDDVGDLPAFAEVTGRGGLAIAVDHGGETDKRVREAAALVLEGTEAMAEWLAELTDRLSR